MYAKIFSQILDSSIARDAGLRRMFQDLLILANSDGVIDMTHFAIAQRLVIPEAEVRKQIAKLCEEDPESRTRTNGGRRLIPLDQDREWGWQVVNYVAYRAIRQEEDRREYQRELMRAKRELDPTYGQRRNVVSNVVSSGEVQLAEVSKVSQSISIGRSISKSRTTAPKKGASVELPSELKTPEFERAWGEWRTYLTEKKKTLTASTAKRQLQFCLTMGGIKAVQAIEKSITCGWTGLFEPKADTSGAGPATWGDPDDAVEAYIKQQKAGKV